MRLCDKDIKRYLADQKIVMTPPPAEQSISGLTVDVHLGHQFRIFHDHNVPFIDLSGPKEQLNSQLEKVMSDEIYVSTEGAFHLHPGQLALAVTHESVQLPADMVGWLDGRSSLARLGLMVHVTAHRIDPGWCGAIVLECYNSGPLPLALKPLMPIGALSFEILSAAAEKPYNCRDDAKYKNQQGAVSSRIDQD